METRATVISPGPERSSLGGGSDLDSLRMRDPTTIPTIPIGMFTRKTDLQDSPAMSSWIRIPPRSWAITVADPLTPARIPMARSLSWPANATWIIEKICSYIIAAPRPCKPLAAIRKSGEDESPQAAEHAVNTPIQAKNIFFRPKISPSLPPVIRKTAFARE
jgi:hypothetical protein